VEKVVGTNKTVTMSQKVISGESFGAESLEQAKLIQRRTAELSVQKVR
jgi:hypothetical protein